MTFTQPHLHVLTLSTNDTPTYTHHTVNEKHSRLLVVTSLTKDTTTFSPAIIDTISERQPCSTPTCSEKYVNGDSIKEI